MSLTRSTFFACAIAAVAALGCQEDRTERGEIQDLDDITVTEEPEVPFYDPGTTGTGTAAPSGRGAVGGAVVEHGTEGDVPDTVMTDDAGHTLHVTGARDSEQANMKRDILPRQTRRSVQNRRSTTSPVDSTVNQNPAKDQSLDLEGDGEETEVEPDRDVDDRGGY